MTETLSPPNVGVAARAVDASKIYGSGEAEVRALNNISVAFQTARLTAIMGPSGSGKSTLLHCLAGLDRLTSGQIFLGDVDISHSNEKELTLIRRDKLGFIFQAYNLIPTLNALENMMLPMSLAGTKPDPAWLETVVQTVRLGDRLTHRPAELSGGQQQRVAVGRALLSRPEIIFADEPTGNLDSRSGAEILTFMRKAVDDLGQTIVMVTHDPIAAGYADRVVFLADGAIVDELDDPNADSIIDKMKSLGAVGPTMWKVTLKGIWAKKVRFLLTGIAVILGVAFVSGTFVLTATISKTFDGLFSDIYKNTDAVVRGKAEFDGAFDIGRGRIDASLLPVVRSADGVAGAAGTVQGFAVIVDKKNDAVGSTGNGAPNLGFAWIKDRELSSLHLVAGKGPRAPNQIVIDKKSADDAGYKPGDTVPVVTKTGRANYDLTGIVKFGDSNSLLGATITAFTPATAAKVLAVPGTYDNISVKAAAGVSQQEVVRNIRASLQGDPQAKNVEVLTGDAVTTESQDNFKDQLSFFSTFLLVFGVIALLVGSFIIFNTFSIIVAQRGRELALLRALGAGQRQVINSVLVEAVLVGLTASIIGFVGGILLAGALEGPARGARDRHPRQVPS